MHFPIKQQSLVTIFLWALILPQVSFAAPFMYTWDVKALAAMDGERVQLRDKRRKVLKTVDTSQMRYLYAVKTSMEEVAETRSDLLIVDGAEPNAFAGQMNGKRNVVGINFAMLDIIGMDVHSAAALIGHELAHLRLNHGDKQQSRSTKFGVMRILGGAALDSLGVPGAQMISNLTFTSIETKYSRENEREADYLGVIWAIEAGYQSDGAARLHEEIFKRSESSPVPFLSSHPSGPERIATLKSLSRRLSQ